MPGPTAASLRVLVADDEPVSRRMTRALLMREGHTVIEARNGAEAIALHDADRPDVVLMDIEMPGLDGCEATAAIKAHAGDRFVPVIVLTKATAPEELSRALAAGADAFLMKPVNRLLLRSQIDAMERIRQLHSMVHSQNAQLSLHQARVTREHEVSSELLARLLRRGGVDSARWRYFMQPAEDFSGDIVLVATTPEGIERVLVGDFTGHGLTAAIGALPAADEFYRLTAQGVSAGEVARAINLRLRESLPQGLFFAACIVDLDLAHASLAIWNGGIPDVAIVPPEGGLIRWQRSAHLPLGILEPKAFDSTTETVRLASGTRVVIYSDGVIDAVDPEARRFGHDRLEAALAAGCGLDGLRESLAAFQAGTPARDDITLVELIGPPWQNLPTSTSATRELWSAQLQFSAPVLRTLRLRGVVDTIVAAAATQLPERRDAVAFACTELVKNALHYGVLRLDSRLKQTAEGFGAFHDGADTALSGLATGWVRCHMRLLEDEGGRRLEMVIEDSGPGFEYGGPRLSLEANTTFGGRGIALATAICDGLSYEGSGNRVVATFTCADAAAPSIAPVLGASTTAGPGQQG